MTTLSANQIAALSAILTGGDVKRAATKAAAEKRFLTVLTERVGETIASESRRDILDAGDFETAGAMVEAAIRAAAGAAAPAKEETTTDEQPAGSPGLARLRASAEAEEIRAAVLADQQVARETEKARVQAIIEPSTAPEKKPAPAPKPRKEGAATRTRLDLTAKITLTVEANPKREGTRAFARFTLYTTGQTVEQYIAACEGAGFPASEAKADLSWDRRHGFIAVG